MTTTEIIGEIQRLPRLEQEKIVRFAYELDANRQLSGVELAALAQRMIDTTDLAEKVLLREALVRGFYGGLPDA